MAPERSVRIPSIGPMSCYRAVHTEDSTTTRHYAQHSSLHETDAGVCITPTKHYSSISILPKCLLTNGEFTFYLYEQNSLNFTDCFSSAA